MMNSTVADLGSESVASGILSRILLLLTRRVLPISLIVSDNSGRPDGTSLLFLTISCEQGISADITF